MDITQIGLAFAAFGIGMLSPGPNILAVIGTSMGAGRRAGIALALGVSAGSFLWATLTAVGLAALIAAYAALLTAIKIAGGLYLLWLAFKAFRMAASAAPLQEPAAAPGGRFSRFFLRGLTIQMMNPKAALTWIAIMSLGLGHEAPASAALVIVAGTTALSVAGHILYAVAFSTRRAVAFYGKARRVIEAVLGTFFMLAGLKLLASRNPA